MATLPTPGPGRPQHPSYSEPGPLVSPFELLVIFLLAIAIGGAWTLLEVAAGA